MQNTFDDLNNSNKLDKLEKILINLSRLTQSLKLLDEIERKLNEKMIIKTLDTSGLKSSLENDLSTFRTICDNLIKL